MKLESRGQVFEVKSISWFHSKTCPLDSKTCPPDSSLRKLRREYSLWNRVITRTSPGIASENAPYSEVEAFDGAVLT